MDPPQKCPNGGVNSWTNPSVSAFWAPFAQFLSDLAKREEFYVLNDNRENRWLWEGKELRKMAVSFQKLANFV